MTPRLTAVLAAGCIVSGFLSACSGSPATPNPTTSPAADAFGGSASAIPVSTGPVGSQWWTWTLAPGLDVGDSSVVPTAQRYFVLDSWLFGGNAARAHLATAPVIASLAEGPASAALSTTALVATGVSGGPFGSFGEGYVSAVTASAKAASVTICALRSTPHSGQQSKPTAAELATALRHASPGASTVRLRNDGAGWRVVEPGKGGELPASCRGWAQQLRRAAGLPSK